MNDVSGTTAVILAGGLGTRLRSVVADRPKVLAEVDGVPFVFHLLAQLAAAGVKHVVLSTGYLGEQVRDTVGSSWGSLEVEYAQEPSPLGTGGAIRRTLPLVRSQALFVLNGDSYCDVDLASLWLWHHQRAAHGTLTLSRVDDARRYGTVETDAYGRVTRFAEKSPRRRAGTVNAGLYLLRPRFLTKAESVVFLLLRAAFPRHEIFPKIRLADVLQVKIGPQGMERLRAFRKIANQHVGFVICDRDMTIIAIVDSKEPDQVVNPRDQKLEVIKQRCLQAAQVKYICVYPPQLPRYRELREQILGPAADLVQ